MVELGRLVFHRWRVGGPHMGWKGVIGGGSLSFSPLGTAPSIPNLGLRPGSRAGKFSLIFQDQMESGLKREAKAADSVEMARLRQAGKQLQKDV